MNTGVEMRQPKGTLTSDQLEIMKVVWNSDQPVTAAEIWQALTTEKQTARTTVVTLVKRLAERGWLRQEGSGRGATYRAACSQTDATARLGRDFLDRFFGGSPSRFVMNLLGGGQISEAEAKRLRKMLDDYQGWSEG
jgi:predicted transcriptional regulator